MVRVYLIFVMAALATAGEAAQGWVPSYFAENRGQAPADIRYVLKRPGSAAYFRERGVAFELAGGGMVETRFVGAVARPAMAGRGALEGSANFFTGTDRTRWTRRVPLYGELVYGGLWPGVDLAYSADSQSFKSEFRVSARADASVIRWRYGPEAAVSIGEDGSLRVRAWGQTIREGAPVVYQETDGRRSAVACAYAIQPDGTVGFRLGEYDRGRELVIDPVIVFSSYLGGSGQDSATAVAADGLGNIVVAGYTSSANFPATGAARQPHSAGGVDAFVAKFGGSGGHLIFCTFLGGSGDDRAFGLSLDAAGNIYLVGRTGSTNFPLASALQTALRGTEDAFVTKLNPAGNQILYSTYLGGSNVDGAVASAVDAAGYLYVTGDTLSTDFPVNGGYKNTAQGAQDAFVVKFTPTGSALVYGTYLGGNGVDHAAAIAVNANGNAFVTGSTYSPNFPAVLAVQAASGGNQDAFVTELSVSGSALIFSTFLGGSGGTPGLPEEGDAIALDAAGNIYVGGTTSSANFPTTVSALQPGFGGGNQDAFLVEYSASGQSIRYASFLGGSGVDYVSGLAMDAFGYLTAVGYTSSGDFPAVRAAQSGFRGNFDAFVAKFNFSGSSCSLTSSTYLGGALSDAATAVALDRDGNALVAGFTSSTDFPVVAPATGLGAVQGVNNGIGNAFVAKLAAPYTRVTVEQTASGPLFGVDFSRDRLWDSQSFSGGYYRFGNPGDVPIAGDWTHSGTVKIGVFRNGLWILDTNGNGVLDGADRQFTFGQAGDIPVMGDWDGSGALKAGVFRAGTWILDYSGHMQGAATGQSDKTYSFGSALDTPVTGNWTGTSSTQIGIFRNGFWIIDANGDGALTAADPWYFFGQAGDAPITGDWDGSGVTHPGIVRGGTWFLNYQWNSPVPLTFAFGAPGAVPLVGKNF